MRISSAILLEYIMGIYINSPAIRGTTPITLRRKDRL